MNINDEIINLIIRHLSGESSGADDVRLQQWLKVSAENRQEFEKIVTVWNASASAPPQNIDVDREWQKFRNRHFAEKQGSRVFRLPFTQVWRYAATVIILIGLGAGVLYFNGSDSYQTFTGERFRVDLQDGTTVILGENSVLKVPRTFNWYTRNMELTGEGFFEVAPNPEKPFKIDGPVTSTQVLGTAFQLIATNTQNLIRVSEGKVAYWKQEKADTLILTPGEEGIFENNRLEESPIQEVAYNSWKTGVFVFENEKVTHVLRNLQNYYLFNISNLEEYDDLDCRFSGKFENQDLNDVLEELSLTMGMEYELSNASLKIHKFYCE